MNAAEKLCYRCGKLTNILHEIDIYVCNECFRDFDYRELGWTKTPPTDMDVGKWFVYRYSDHSVHLIAELTFSCEMNRKLVLGMELEKLVKLGCEFYGPLPG